MRLAFRGLDGFPDFHSSRLKIAKSCGAAIVASTWLWTISPPSQYQILSGINRLEIGMVLYLSVIDGGPDMERRTQEPAFNVETMVISQMVPPEVVDSGRVRLGGGVHIFLDIWQIFRHLPFFQDLMR